MYFCLKQLHEFDFFLKATSFIKVNQLDSCIITYCFSMKEEERLTVVTRIWKVRTVEANIGKIHILW